MVSKYLKYKNSFDSLHDPVKESMGHYWYIESKSTPHYCWNNQVFTDIEIERIKVIGRRLGTSRAYTGNNNLDCLDHRRSFTSWIHPNQNTSWIYERLTTLVCDNNKKFFNYDITKIETLQFTYYESEEDGCYKPHVDPLNWNMPHNRKLSMILQLSDPNEYEGGDIMLHSSYQPEDIRKEKGYVITFPSHILHEVTPVTRGKRYSLVGWVHGPLLK